VKECGRNEGVKEWRSGGVEEWRSGGVKSAHHYNLENNKYFPS